MKLEVSPRGCQRQRAGIDWRREEVCMSIDHRRRFLQLLAASPITAASPAVLAQLLPQSRPPDPIPWAALQPDKLIKSPKEAINVFDFEPVARQNRSEEHTSELQSR